MEIPIGRTGKLNIACPEDSIARIKGENGMCIPNTKGCQCVIAALVPEVQSDTHVFTPQVMGINFGSAADCC